MSLTYKPVNIGALLDKYSAYNTTPGRGVDRATKAGLAANTMVADSVGSQSQDINSQLAGAINDLLRGLNNRNASNAQGQAQELNALASLFASEQSRSLNEGAITAAGEQANQINLGAQREGTTGAIDASTQINQYASDEASRLNQAAAGVSGEVATGFNERATGDVDNAMSRLFGGDGEAFNKFRDQVNSNLQDLLSGQVSQSTRRELARASIRSGATELGGQSAADFYTGYLGLTSEQLKQQGAQQYQSLYSLYRQSVPIVSGAQLFDRFALSPGQMSQQATAQASQLAGLGSVSAQQIYGNNAISANQLLQMGGTSASQLYGTNSISASQMYGTNALSANNMFQTSAVPTSQIVPLTTLSPAQAIAFEIEQSKAATQSKRAQAAMDLNWFKAISQAGGIPQSEPQEGSGSGMGLRTGSLSSSNPWDTGFFDPVKRSTNLNMNATPIPWTQAQGDWNRNKSAIF